MTQRLKFGFLMLLAGFAAWMAPSARADEWDKQTVVTFNDTVEIPGLVLPAGTYVFKLADSSSNRDIVQIFTEDQKHLVATVLTIPDHREDPTDKTVVTFEERASGSPEALHSWFYPGDTDGVEFVYPKSEGRYATTSEQATPSPEPAPAPPAPVQQQAAADQPTPEEQVPVVREQEDVIVAQEIPAAPTESSSADENTVPDTLPQTSGNFAMFPLLGLGLLSGGFTALRFATKQS
jgi:hypothetical protein